MNPNTGAIVEVLSQQQGEQQGLVPIPEDKLEELKAASPYARKVWAANEKNRLRKKKKADRKKVAKVRAKARDRR